jgi:very-short-patch-repair endonuclease
MSQRDATILALAVRQYGVFSHEQARAAGFPERTIHYRRTRGIWETVGHRVYRLPGARPEPEQRLMAAVLGLHDAVVTHEAGGWLHQLQHLVQARMVVSVPVRTTHQFADVAVRECSFLPEEHRTEIRGFPVTTLERTVCDLAGSMPAKRYERLLDDLLCSHRLLWDPLVATFDAMPTRGRRGRALLGELLDARGPGYRAPMSVLEQEFRDLVRAAGIDEPVLQFQLPWRTTPDGFVDFTWLDAKLIIEVDGRRWHARDEAWGADTKRDAEATVHGWLIQRFTYDQIMNEPGWVQDTVRRLLATRRLQAGAAS